MYTPYMYITLSKVLVLTIELMLMVRITHGHTAIG